MNVSMEIEVDHLEFQRQEIHQNYHAEAESAPDCYLHLIVAY